MPVTTADVSNADKPAAEKSEPKTKAAKSALADAAASSDPLVMKLMWDRGHRDSDGDTAGVATIDAELRKLGFDI